MEYSFDINSETEKFELYYLKCIFAGRAHEGFILFIHQKCKGEYRKSYLQCRSVQGNISQPFRVTILFSYFSGTIQIPFTRR